jgi:hypothetical protein
MERRSNAPSPARDLGAMEVGVALAEGATDYHMSDAARRCQQRLATSTPAVWLIANLINEGQPLWTSNPFYCMMG